jgi:RNA polymerase sigma factor (sigma-70 family)
MMTTKLMPVAMNNDAELVSGTLAGNRDAFGHIVSRYQSLICSLAYSATGSLGQSEDLAQETFITAWKHLGHLRERDKLRAWLCGIARNRINSFLRREGHEPIREAEPLEHVSGSRSSEPLPGEQAISNEEQAILWRSLERIPEIYREPLVLFYREHQSIGAVAQNLDLTEDTVKQRLSRGRKLLHEQVLAFVEGALERTNPGKVFTLGVLAALPALAISAKAATLGTAAAKGSATAKAAGAMGLLGDYNPAAGHFWQLRQLSHEPGRGANGRRAQSHQSAFPKFPRGRPGHFHRAGRAVILGVPESKRTVFVLGVVVLPDHRHLFFDNWCRCLCLACGTAQVSGRNFGKSIFRQFSSRCV